MAGGVGTKVGGIFIEATLDTGKFIDAARKMGAQSKTLETQMTRSFKNISAASRSFAATLGIGLGAGLLAGAVKRSLEYAASLSETAQQLGVTTRELQTFRFAAQQNGASLEEADNALKRFNISTSKAVQGSEEMRKAFLAAGVTLDDLKTKSKTELIGQIADQFLKTGGAAKNAANGTALFSKAFSAIIPTLDQGSAGMNRLFAAADELGIVLSDDLAKGADDALDKLEAVKTMVGASFASAVAQSANSIVSLAQAFGQLTAQLIRFMSAHPEAALGILGALAGSRFGPLGTAIGAAGGALAGAQIGQSAEDANMNLEFRRKKLLASRAELLARRAAAEDKGSLIRFRKGSGAGGTVASAEKEFNKQVELANRAAAMAIAGTIPRAPTGTPPEFLASGGAHKTKKGPTDKSDETLRDIAREQVRAEMSVLQAKQELAHTSEERTAIALQLIELERQQEEAAINDRVEKAKKDLADGEITKATFDRVVAEAEILKEKNNEVARLKEQAIREELAERNQEATFEAQAQQRDFAIDSLRHQDQMAKTQSEHRRIQLAILDAEIEQKRLELEHQKQLAERNGATAAEIQIIQDKIDHLGAERAQGAENIQAGTRSPLDEWLNNVPQSADEITEAFQKIQVQGLDRLADSLTDVIMGTKDWKEALHELAASFIADSINMIIRMMMMKALMAAFGLGGSGLGAGGTGIFGATGLGSHSLGGGLAGFASGGSFTVHGRGGIDQNVLSMNGFPVARISDMERVSISNDNEGPMPPPMSFSFHNDFRGSDPAAVAAIGARQQMLEQNLPRLVVQAWTDADSRFVFKGRR